MPTGWRIVKSSRADSAFDGEGARLHGGRWSSPGTRVVYTAQSVSLAALELLVHLHESQLLSRYSLIAAEFDAAFVREIGPLPAGWNANPAPIELQEIGDRWAGSHGSLVLQVPSAVVPAESNFLINPAHSDFARIRIGAARPFEWDSRLRRARARG